MASKSEQRRQAVQRESAETTVPQKRFYFPDVQNGVTIMATSIEEANEKLAALLAEQAPAEESPNK